MERLELRFCEQYEGKVKELELLTILKDDLTAKGLETYNKIKEYVVDNLDRYLTLTGK